MLQLAPEIQQHILSMPDVVRRPAITERALRPIAQISQARDQLEAFQVLLKGGATLSCLPEMPAWRSARRTSR
jgi:hypothetical protein